MSREVTTKANALIEASYRFEMLEMQILLYGLSLINPFSKEFPTEYKIDVKDFAELFHKDTKNAYREIKKTVFGNFWERAVSYRTQEGKTRKDRWLISAEYADSEGYLKVFFNPNLKPYLHQLTSNFTVYYLDQVINFKSFYSVRIYEFCIMKINITKTNECNFILELREVKNKLNLQERYSSRYDNFKHFVLNKAKSEINEHSDLTIDFEEIKKGRTVESIKFKIQRKEGTKPARYQKIEQSIPAEESIQPQSKPVLPTAEEMAQEMLKQSIKERLINFGITEKVANQFIQKYSDHYIEQHIDYTLNKMKQGSVTNSAAFLVDSINHGYAT